MVTEISKQSLSLTGSDFNELSDMLLNAKDTVFSYHLTEFTGSVSSLTLRRSLELNLRYEDGLYILANDELNLFSFSDSLKTAVSDIEQYLLFLWEEYVLEDEANLTPESIQLKKTLQEILQISQEMESKKS
ncbi:hypothetical protein MmiAt1_06740 [Methanimicrococcus sp. At1]|uniref:Uncharacterized protein n=1 Tax=Methanimicrococcus hacksteinii TaxID=3028293 RepID=A0ABU3VNY4_9EURY|nr:hypothetical protein [Methanimicrococcus sp. At1]MDV0445117.1 hypothetical protein [Methanimicrococcus sp. At1]